MGKLTTMVPFFSVPGASFISGESGDSELSLSGGNAW